jgi:hypothetical protein
MLPGSGVEQKQSGFEMASPSMEHLCKICSSKTAAPPRQPGSHRVCHLRLTSRPTGTRQIDRVAAGLGGVS